MDPLGAAFSRQLRTVDGQGEQKVNVEPSSCELHANSLRPRYARWCAEPMLRGGTVASIGSGASSESKRNPTPRTVISHRGSVGLSSSLTRSRRTWVSSVRVSAKSRPDHSRSISSSPSQTRFGGSRRTARRSNSRPREVYPKTPNGYLPAGDVEEDGPGADHARNWRCPRDASRGHRRGRPPQNALDASHEPPGVGGLVS